MQDWIMCESGPLPHITLPHWQTEGVALGFTTRQGGVSQGIYKSLNLGLHVGDQEELVLENRRRLAAVMASGLDDMVCCEQVHGGEVTVVGTGERGRGIRRLDDALPGYDAMITAEPGVYLLSFYADCVPVYIFDPVHRVVASAHCGWKGTMARITVNALAVMNREFGTQADAAWAFIGPGIGPCCFQISPDLGRRVHDEFPEWHDIISTTGDSQYWNLTATNARILQAVGIKPDNISICELCTACHRELFFSFRRDRGETGRMAAWLGLQR